tara:strand:- start:365 stop:616 length:252 start_codon:yes stop_codon:yes gene_type:complete
MEKKIKKVFSDVFAVQSTKINNNTSFDNFEPWDSLKHTNLIIALEETFNIKFSSSEIIEMLNFKIIKSTIDKKRKKKFKTFKY